MGTSPGGWLGRHGILGFGDAPSLTMVDGGLEYAVNQVRKTPSWPRSWANSSLS